MKFETKMDNYADLLISHGLNVQPGQLVNLVGEWFHRDLLLKLVQAAYKKGAKYVNVDFVDPLHTKIRVENSQSEDFLNFVPKFVPSKYDELVDTHGANLRLVGSEDPDCLTDLPPKPVNQVRLHISKALKRFYQEGVGKSQVQWTVAAAATPKWAKKIFPELSETRALAKLWTEIFKICRVDKPNYLQLWQKHANLLKKRGQKLTDLRIKTLHFTGPGTDFKVFLSPKAIFVGGNSKSPRNCQFEANIPTEECFTTPDCRLTEGHVRVTRPFFVNGVLVEGLELTFKQGKITDFHAKRGKETFQAYIDSDKGGRSLGEVALVGIDSPVYKSGRVFQEILYDENAACHIAVGFAYHFCLENGGNLNAEELKALGYNESHIHTDMMISSEEVDVKALTYDGKEIPLIKKGKWVIA